MLENLKIRWRDIVIIGLVVSNIFLMYSYLTMKRDVSDIEYTMLDNKENLGTLKIVCSMLERKIDNIQVEVENLQEANKYKPFW